MRERICWLGCILARQLSDIYLSSILTVNSLYWYYLSSTFDTIDHSILLGRLHSKFCITDLPLAWLMFCLIYLPRNRTQCVGSCHWLVCLWGVRAWSCSIQPCRYHLTSLCVSQKLLTTHVAAHYMLCYQFCLLLSPACFLYAHGSAAMV